jgi:hypothetical protein
MTFGSAQRPLDLLLAQPLVRRCKVPSEDSEDSHSAQDDRGKVERVGRHGEVERRDHDLRTVQRGRRAVRLKLSMTHGKNEPVE